ncbi:MAG: hypothetical protein MRY83_23570 [Flavobacteriales bacterium]|nr:hypothetical protein [Flavobacteriales bacterium]
MRHLLYLVVFILGSLSSQSQTTKTLLNSVLNEYICLVKHDAFYTVKDDFVVKFEANNKIYYDTSQYHFDNLWIYGSKYPEFLSDTPKSDVCVDEEPRMDLLESSLLDFLVKRVQLQPGDVHLSLSHPIKNGAFHFIEVYEVVPGKNNFHSRLTTFKFNLSGSLMDRNSWNFYQYSYNNSTTFFENEIAVDKKTKE